MSGSLREVILDLAPVATESGRVYHPSIVAGVAADGHWNAWLEFVDPGSGDVLRTGIETHQANEADLHHWASVLSDVYLQGAVGRATVSRGETAIHRRSANQAKLAGLGASVPDPFELFEHGEHVLRRELLLFKPATLRGLILTHELNPQRLDLAKFTKAQLVTFIVTAIEAQEILRGGVGVSPLGG
jgi:hypothetical protein